MQDVAIKALLVDDDPIILALLTTFLADRGYTVEQLPDGEQALRRLKECPGFNLVVTDRNMPRMDGLALCRAIRALPAGPYIYCVMLTAAGDEESLVAAMEAGVDDFLAKPLRFAELGARLHAAERVLRLEADLESRNRSLAEAYGQLSRELELARSLQLGQLPRPAAFGQARFDWILEASSFVGGDVLDCFALDEHHLCFHLIDVSGHGVAAAMMAFNAQHLLTAISRDIGRRIARSRGMAAAVVRVAEEFNRRILAMQDTSLYLTMVFGLLDTRMGRVAFVQAGHPPPLRVARGVRAIGDGGLPVGILDAPGYAAHELLLPPGGRLVLYSDGITDCTDAAGEAFGAARLGDALQAHERAPLPELLGAVRQDLQAWTGGKPFEDDVTLLALEFA